MKFAETLYDLKISIARDMYHNQLVRSISPSELLTEPGGLISENLESSPCFFDFEILFVNSRLCSLIIMPR